MDNQDQNNTNTGQQADVSALTIYNDIAAILEQKGYTQEQIAEVIVKLTTQAEMEVVEQILNTLNQEQLTALDSLPDDAGSDEIVEKLGLDPVEVDAIRAQKVADLISQMTPDLNAEG